MLYVKVFMRLIIKNNRSFYYIWIDNYLVIVNEWLGSFITNSISLGVKKSNSCSF